jgi:hypothetical protein
VRGWSTVDVGVDQHVVVEPVDGVVERGGMEAKLDARSAHRVAQVHQAQPQSGSQAVANAFLFSPSSNRV